MLKALGKRVIVKPEANDDDKTKGGVIISHNKQRYSDIGEITHVGEVVDNFVIGDKVIMPAFGLNIIDLDGVRHYSIFSDDILGKLNGNSK